MVQKTFVGVAHERRVDILFPQEKLFGGNVNRETTRLYSKLFALPLVALALTACAGAGANDLPTLPDDPGVEVVPPTTGGVGGEAKPTPSPNPEPSPTPRPNENALEKYQHLDPSKLVPTNLLKDAVLYFDANQSKFANKSVITIIDFSQRSSERRMFIINMNDGSVWAMPVAHGKGSDPDHDGYAQSFSNVSGSNASSVGFYRGAETYIGSNGLSLRMDGLSSTNSNARSRAIVIHGADYVRDEKVIQGRSWGCPAVPNPYRDRVMAMLKGGSLVYAGLSAK